MSRTRPYRYRPNAEREVFAFIRDHVQEHGVSPTYREIGAACGSMAVSYVARIVLQLQRKEYLRQNGKARGIELLRTEWEG